MIWVRRATHWCQFFELFFNISMINITSDWSWIFVFSHVISQNSVFFQLKWELWFFSYRLISRAKQIFSTNDAYIKNININFIIIVKWILIRCSNMCIVTITFIKIAIEKISKCSIFSRAITSVASIFFNNFSKLSARKNRPEKNHQYWKKTRQEETNNQLSFVVLDIGQSSYQLRSGKKCCHGIGILFSKSLESDNTHRKNRICLYFQKSYDFWFL